MRELLAEHRVVAIIRSTVAPTDELLDALVLGGLRLIEVTLGTPCALETVRAWTDRVGRDTRVGVGTVISESDARRAIDAGADFLVTPNLDDAVLRCATDSAVPVICGAMTPSEIVRAWDLGAAAVKVFPASSIGGPSYVREITAPLSAIPLVAVGGVTIDDAVSYLTAGCTAVGVGSSLVPTTPIGHQECEAISVRARELVASIGGNG